MPSRMWKKPSLTNSAGRLVPARIEFDEARVAVDVEGALGAAGREEAHHRR